MIYPVLLPYFRDSFGLSLTVAGFLVTILWLGSAVGQLPGGILADRYSERSVMTAGAVVVAVAVTTVLLAPTAVALFAATAFVGLGQSLYPVARITILTDLYPDRVGSALGVTMATGDLGQTVMPPIAGALAVGVAWRVGLGFMIPLLVVAAVALWVVLPRQTGAERDGQTFSTDALGDLVSELREGDMLFFVFILFLYILVWQAFTGLYPTYLVEEKGLSSSTAALLFSLFFAFGVVVKPAGGVAYDRIGPRGSLIGVLAGPVVGLGLLPIVESLPGLVVLTALVSTMLGSGAITQSFLSEAFSEEIRGTGLGAVRTTAATLGAGGPVLFGVIADRGYFDEGYFVLSGLMLAVVLLTLRLPEP
jgi:MFS family permease